METSLRLTQSEVAVVRPVTLFLRTSLSFSTICRLSVEKWLGSGPFYSDSLIFNDSPSVPWPLYSALLVSVLRSHAFYMTFLISSLVSIFCPPLYPLLSRSYILILLKVAVVD